MKLNVTFLKGVDSLSFTAYGDESSLIALCDTIQNIYTLRYLRFTEDKKTDEESLAVMPSGSVPF